MTARKLLHAMDPASWAREALGFEPDPMQIQVLRARERRGILNCTRQWGKSTVTAVKAIHHAYFRSESLVLVVSRTERQSAEFLQKCKGFVRRLGLATRGDGQNAVSLKFSNGSRIVGLPSNEDGVRCFSNVGMLLIDEASRVSDKMYDAVTPFLAVSDGSLWLMSTPNGKSGFFYREWSGGEGWARISVPATSCPRIPSRFLDAERRRKGEMMFRQEYLCEFMQEEGALFDEMQVRQRFTPDVAAFVPMGRAS